MNTEEIFAASMFVLGIVIAAFFNMMLVSYAFAKFHRNWAEIHQEELEDASRKSWVPGFYAGQEYVNSGRSREDLFDQIALAKDLFKDQNNVTLKDYKKGVILILEKLESDYTLAQENTVNNWNSEIEFEFDELFLEHKTKDQ